MLCKTKIFFSLFTVRAMILGVEVTNCNYLSWVREVEPVALQKVVKFLFPASPASGVIHARSLAPQSLKWFLFGDIMLLMKLLYPLFILSNWIAWNATSNAFYCC